MNVEPVEGGGKANAANGGKNGGYAGEQRTCFYHNTEGGCNKTKEDCAYQHKGVSAKELEAMTTAKAASKAKGKAACAGSPAAPGGKGQGKGPGKGKNAHAAVAAAHVINLCPLGDDCLDGECWRTKTHISAYGARENPVFEYVDYYQPLDPELAADEQ